MLEVEIVFFVALSAIAVVSTATCVAPASEKKLMPWLAFGGGAVMSVWFAINTQYYAAALAAIAAGLLTAPCAASSLLMASLFARARIILIHAPAQSPR